MSKSSNQPSNGQPTPDQRTMTDHQDANLTAFDVIRCVWLARTAEQRGDLASARRWQVKADTWLRASPPLVVPPPDPQGVRTVPAPTRGP